MTDIEMNGKIKVAPDLVGKVLTINDEHLVVHILKWNTEPLDEYFRKQKAGYYQTIKYDSETYLIKSAHYWQEGKEKWATIQPPQQGGGKGNYVPKNEKPILYESIFKSCCDTAKFSDDFTEGQTYEEKMDRIAAQAKKIYQDIVSVVGA